MSHGHQDPETPRPGPEPYRNRYMTRRRAYDVAIEFGLATGMPCIPRPAGDGFDAVIPMEYLEGLFEVLGALETLR